MARKLNNVVKKNTSAAGEDSSPRKLKNVTVNSSRIYGIERNAEDSFNKLQEYQNRLQNNEYISADEMSAYRKARTDYADSYTRLNGIAKATGGTVDAEYEKQQNDWLAWLDSSFDESDSVFSQFDDAYDYTYSNKYAGMDIKEVTAARDKLLPSVMKTALNEETQREVKWLDDYISALHYNHYKGMSYKELQDTLSYLDDEGYMPLGGEAWRDYEKAWLKDNSATLAWYDKYQGKSYGELKQARDRLQLAEIGATAVRTGYEADEAAWLESYMATVPMAKDDYETELNDIDKKIAEFEADMKELDWRGISAPTEEYAAYSRYFGSKYGYDSGDAYIANLRKRKAFLEGMADYSFLSENEDYEEKSGTIPSVPFWDTTGTDIVEAYNSGQSPFETAPITPGEDYYSAKQMTEEEYKKYFYLYNTQGKEAATDYFNFIKESLNQKAGLEATEGIRNIDNGFLRTLAADAYAIPASLDRWRNDIRQHFTKDAVATPASVYGMEANRESLEGVGPEILGSSLAQLSHDAVSTTTYMVPSIATSIVTKNPTFGKVMLGAAAAGGSTNEALKSGYSQAQARSYGLMVGASEVAIESLFGGIPALGEGSVSGAIFSKSIANIDNALVRAIARTGKYAFDVAGEGVEEYLQATLDPVYRNLLLDENNEIKLVSEEQAYEALMGVIASIPFTAGNVISTNRNIRNRYGDSAEDYVNEALEVNPDDTYAQQMKARLDSGKKLTATQLADIVDRNTGAVLPEHIASVTSRLYELGEVGDIGAVAEAVIKAQYGEEMSNAEKKLIKKSTVARQVLNELTPGTDAFHSLGGDVGSDTADEARQTPDLVTTIAGVKTTGESVKTPSVPALDSIVRSKDGIGYRAVATDGKDTVVYGVDPETGNFTTSAGVVSAEQITFSDRATKAVFDNARNYSDTVADLYIGAYDPGTATVAEYDQAFDRFYGAGNVLNVQSFEDAWNNYSVYGIFDKATAEVIYKAGQNEARIANHVRSEFRKGKSRVYVDVDRKSLTSRQKVSIEAMEAIAGETGIRFYTFASYVKEDGKRYYKDAKGVEKLAPNGYYDPSDSSIHIDLNAGKDGEGTMLFTVSHELTHYIKQWSPKKFEVLADFLIEQYGKKGVSVEALIQAQIEKASANNRTIDDDTAFEEVVADSMESMLTDGKVAEKLTMLAEKDMSLVKKIKSYLKQLFEKIKQAYAGLNPNSREGKLVAEMGDAVEKLQNLFAEAITDASANMARANGSVGAENIVEGQKSENGLKYMDRDGSQKEATELSQIDLEQLLEEAQYGVLLDSTYIPLRRNTPAFFIDVVKEHSKGTVYIEDYPMAASVEHIRQNMEEEEGLSYGDSRPHGFSIDDIITISRKMGDPAYIVLQENGRYAEVVSFYNNRKKEVIVSIDFADIGPKKTKNYKYAQYMNGFNAGYYNIIVTQYEPESLQTYLNNNEVVYNKKEMNGKYQVGSGRIVAVTHDTPFIEDIVPQSDDSVKKKFSDRDLDAVSSRSILADALESVAQTEAEKTRLSEYKEKADTLDQKQAELAKIRAQIKELAFAKGKKDTAKIAELRKKAAKLASSIDYYDKQLLSLEATKDIKAVLQREKAKAAKRQKAKDAAMLEKYKEGRKKTELRTKIKKFKAKLESAMLNPTDNTYVPAGLISAMVDVCELIDTDTDLYKKDGSLNKAQEARNLTRDRLLALEDEYSKLAETEEYVIGGEFDESVQVYLKDLRTNYSGKRLSEMSLDELSVLYEVLNSINDVLQDAKSLIGFSEAVDVYEAADSIVGEQRNIAAKHRKGGKRNVAQKGVDLVVHKSLSPVRAAERMSGYNRNSFLVKLFNNFEKGVRKKNMFKMHAYKTFEDVVTGENAAEYESAMYDAYGHEYTDDTGRTFRITKMQAMQALLSYEREQANKKTLHIENGGLNFADIDLLSKGKLGDAIDDENIHRVRSDTAVAMVEEFREMLKEDAWAQKYMEAARTFFNSMAKDAINSTMLAVKHRIVAKDNFYIPYEVDKSFVVMEITGGYDMQQTINSYGMLQQMKDGATQPLIVTGLNNIIDRHIEQVGTVYGLAVPVRDFNKVWNARSGVKPVNVAIGENWGKDAKELITQAVADIQSPRVVKDDPFLRKVKSNYISATFFMNFSVISKQIGSMYSARSMIRHRSAPQMLANLAYTIVNYKKLSAEVDKYTASVWMRRQGVSDAEVYDLLTEGKKHGIGKVASKIPIVKHLPNLIAAMDSAVALSLWKYCKQDVAKATGKTGETLLEVTAEYFDEVVENTQSMADVLHRPEIQKQGGIMGESFGMFKTDLYQMAGQLQTALGRHKAEGTKESKRALTKAAYGCLSSAIWASFMTTLFALGRYKVDPYRDDEDELTAESWLKYQSLGLIGDLAGYIFPLGGGELFGVAKRFITGESDELVDSLALTAIQDGIDTVFTIADSLKEGEMPSPSEIDRFLGKSLQMFSVPYNNVSRAVKAINYHVRDIANGEFLSFNAGRKGSTAASKVEKYTGYVDDKNSKAAKEYISSWIDDRALELIANDELETVDVDEDEYLKAYYTNEAKKDVRGYFNGKYKEEYLDGVEKGDWKATKRIKQILAGTGLYNDVNDTFVSWRRSAIVDKYELDYKRAYTTNDTKAMEKIKNAIVATDLWTNAEVSKKLKSWRKSADELTEEAEG